MSPPLSNSMGQLEQARVLVFSDATVGLMSAAAQPTVCIDIFLCMKHHVFTAAFAFVLPLAPTGIFFLHFCCEDPPLGPQPACCCARTAYPLSPACCLSMFRLAWLRIVFVLLFAWFACSKVEALSCAAGYANCENNFSTKLSRCLSFVNYKPKQQRSSFSLSCQILDHCHLFR